MSFLNTTNFPILGQQNNAANSYAIAMRGLTSQQKRDVIEEFRGKTLIPISSSRSGNHYRYQQIPYCYNEQYEKPVYYGPHRTRRQMLLDDYSAEERLIHALTMKYRDDPWFFFGKYYSQIFSFKPELAPRPWKYGTFFASVCNKVWHNIMPVIKPPKRERARFQYPNNRYTVLRAEEPPEVEDVDEVEIAEEAKETSFMFPTVDTPLPPWDYSHPLFKVKENRLSRHIRILRIKISCIIYNLRLKRSSKFINYFKSKLCCNIVMPEADDDGAHDTSLVTQTLENVAGNTTLISQRSASVAVAEPVQIPITISAGEQEHQFSTLMNRWLQLETFEWDATKPRSSILKEISLPSYLLDKRATSANAAVIQSFAYMRPDVMEVQIMVNSNKFQYGQLQCAWFYDTLADANIKLRKHVSCFSQTMHCLVNAGSSNPGTLSIPFISPYTYLPTVERDDDKTLLHLGSLYIVVLTPLTCTANTTQKANVTISIKFPKCSFAGMKDRNLGTYVTPQMETGVALASVALAERLLNSSNSDGNRDNPPYVQARTPIVPQAAQSYCAGDNAVEVINHLRLDPRGQTQHFTPSSSEMTIRELAQKYGLISSWKWSKDDIYGKILFSYDASPAFDQTEYDNVIIQSNICYYMPPVAVVANLFANWRGCLKMRIDVVKNQFYSGRLLICYIPRILTTPKIETALSSPYVVFDVQECDTVEFTVPYITNRFAWPRRQGNSESADVVAPPGRVWVFVLNPLIPMESVPDSIYLNVYWAGHDDFEVGVPAQPSIGTSFWTTDDASKDEVKAYGGYFPWYVGYYSDFYEGKKAICRYGKGWQHVAQFRNLKPECWYSVNSKYTKAVHKMKKNDGTQFTPMYFCPINLDDGLGWQYLGVMETRDNAITYARQAENAKDRSLFMDVYPDDDGEWCDGNPVFDIHSEKSEADFVIVDAKTQADERDISPQYSSVLPSTSSGGALIWGETFTSLKTLCRRYQPYALTTIELTSTLGDVSFMFPVVPQGLDLRIEEAEKLQQYYQKYVRDGVIPIVSSGFRFFRGSIDFQLIVTPQKELNVWVQHRPDYDFVKWGVVTPGSQTSAAAFLNTGYAMHLQTTRVNNVIGFTVPYYKPFTCIYSQRTDLTRPPALRASSLGCVSVGVEGAGKGNATVLIMYALADDASFSVFQGFPPMLLLNNIAPKLQQQTAIRYARTQGWSDWLPSVTVKHTIDPASVNEVVQQGLQASDSAVAGSIEALVNAAGGLAAKGVELGSDLLIQVGHIILNPTVRSIAWAIASIFIKIGVITITSLSRVVEIMVNLLNKLRVTIIPAVSTNNQAVATVVPQSGDDEIFGITSSLITLVLMGVSQASNCVIDPPKNVAHFTKVLTKGLGTTLRSGVFFQTFLRNNINFFKRISMYVTNYFHKDKLFERMLTNDMHPLIEWCEEVEILLDPSNDERTFARDSRWADRLEYAYAIGTRINKSFCGYQGAEDFSRTTYQAFSKLYSKLIRKREDMYKRGLGTVSRCEPFTIWFSGASGCGKSTVMQTLIPILLKSESIKYEGESTFTLQAGSAFWTGCRSQPAMLIDDMLNIQTGEIRDTALRDFNMVKSPAALNPPQAALEDKEARYAPELLVVASNYAYPVIPCIDNTTVYRRREVLVNVYLKPEVVLALQNIGSTTLNVEPTALKKLQAICNVDFSKYEHLLFEVAINPADPTSAFKLPMDWVNFVSYCKAQFSAYRNNQRELYRSRMAAYEEALEECDADDMLSLQGKKEAYMRLCTFIQRYDRPLDMTLSEFYKLGSNYANELITEDQINVMLTLRERIARNVRVAKTQADDSEQLVADVYEASTSTDPAPPRVQKNHIKMFNTNPNGCVTCIHYHFRGSSVYCEDCDGNNGNFLVFGKTDEANIRIPDALCADSLCKWRDEKAYKADMKLWGSDPVNSKLIKDKPPIAPRYYRERWAKAKLVQVNDKKAVLTSSSLGKKFSEMRETIIAKIKNFYDNYILPVFSKLWAFIKWSAPLLSFLGLIVSAVYIFTPSAVAQWSRDCTQHRIADNLARINTTLGEKSKPDSSVIASSPPSFKEAATPQLNSSGDVKTTKAVSKATKPVPQMFGRRAQTQAVYNQNQEDICEVFKRNTWFMSGSNAEITTMPNRFVFVHDNCAIMPYHYIKRFRNIKVDRVVIHAAIDVNVKREFIFSDLKVKEIPGRDLCVVEFSGMPRQKSLIKHIASAEGHAKPKGQCTLIVPKTTIGDRVPVEVEENVIVSSYGDYDGVIDGMYGYNHQAPGVCGALLLNLRLQSPILGMHVSGGGSHGYAEPLFKESFQHYFDLEEAPVGITRSNIYDERLGGAFVPYGVTDEGLAHNQSSETAHVPSLVAGIFPIMTEPAPLGRNDPRVEGVSEGIPYSPLWEGCANMTKPIVDIPDEILDPVMSAHSQRMHAICKPVVNKIGMRTIAEAIVGIPGLKYYDGLDMHTSEGFPFSRYRPPGVHDKSWLFNINDKNEYLGMYKPLADYMYRNQTLRQAGIIPVTPFDDCLKDARIAKEKCKERGKTRVFSTCPVSTTIHIKQSFGDWQAAYKTHRIALPHAIGINPDGAEWGILARAMAAKGDYYITGDYKNFGPSLCTKVVRRVMYSIIEWYEIYWDGKMPRGVRMIMESLTEEITYAYHITNDLVWQAMAGIPSGCPLTVEINSEVNAIYLACAWRVIHINTPLQALHHFHERVALTTYGDDCFMATDEEIAQNYNNQTISNVFAQWGIRFTDASKIGNVPYVRSLSDVTFLKRSFKRHPLHPHEWLAPLDEDISVKDVANWVVKNDDMKFATEQSIISCNLNAYSLGPEKFSDIQLKLNEALVRIKSSVILRTWEDIDMLHYSQYYPRYQKCPQPNELNTRALCP